MWKKKNEACLLCRENFDNSDGNGLVDTNNYIKILIVRCKNGCLVPYIKFRTHLDHCQEKLSQGQIVPNDEVKCFEISNRFEMKKINTELEKLNQVKIPLEIRLNQELGKNNQSSQEFD